MCHFFHPVFHSVSIFMLLSSSITGQLFPGAGQGQPLHSGPLVSHQLSLSGWHLHSPLQFTTGIPTGIFMSAFCIKCCQDLGKVKFLQYYGYAILNFDHYSNLLLLLQPRFYDPVIKWGKLLDCISFSIWELSSVNQEINSALTRRKTYNSNHSTLRVATFGSSYCQF